MLPSGNDASVALATWAGNKLLEDSNSTSTTSDIDKKRSETFE